MTSFYEKKKGEQENVQIIASRAENSISSLEAEALTGMAVEKGRDVYQHFREYGRPATKAIKYVWDYFPPLSWLCYCLVALNAIPLTILIGFIIGTLALVLLVVGTGVLLAEGFFLGIGSLFLIPVIVVLTFSAISTAFFTFSGWSAYKLVIYILRYTGLVQEKGELNALDLKAKSKPKLDATNHNLYVGRLPGILAKKDYEIPWFEKEEQYQKRI